MTTPLSPVRLPPSDHAPNTCAFRDDAAGAWLYHADCLELMDAVAEAFPEGVFDAIFADPPYFLSNGGITCHAGRMVRVDKGGWDKSRGPEINHAFNVAWLSRCRKVLKANGTVWVSGTHHVIHSVGYAMQQLGMKILNDVTWEKKNPPPNLSCRYFTHSTETIIWAARDESARHYFDYDRMRRMNGGRQMKTVWTIAAPRKDEKSFGKHPTQKPAALLDRILLASTREGDLVFDPFAGSATTGVSAIGLGRRFVGCELEPTFVDLAAKRLETALAVRNSRLELAGAHVDGKPDVREEGWRAAASARG